MANQRVPTVNSPSNRPPPKTNGVAKDTVPPPSPRTFTGFSEITSFIWSIADLLRGDYKQADYGKVVLPLTVLRRLDCVLERTKAKVLAKHDEMKKAKQPEAIVEKLLVRTAGVPFYNMSRARLREAEGRPEQRRSEPDLVHQGLLPERARRHRPVQVRRPHRQARRVEPAVPDRGPLCRRQSASRHGARTTSWAPCSRS